MPPLLIIGRLPMKVHEVTTIFSFKSFLKIHLFCNAQRSLQPDNKCELVPWLRCLAHPGVPCLLMLPSQLLFCLFNLLCCLPLWNRNYNYHIYHLSLEPQCSWLLGFILNNNQNLSIIFQWPHITNTFLKNCIIAEAFLK